MDRLVLIPLFPTARFGCSVRRPVEAVIENPALAVENTTYTPF